MEVRNGKKACEKEVRQAKIDNPEATPEMFTVWLIRQIDNDRMLRQLDLR